MDEDHKIHHIHLDADLDESPREYAKLAGVIGGIFLATVFLAWARGFELVRFVSDFMAVFFITFAAFKFVNLDEFAAAYRGYDVVAKRFPVWAIMFPFIEGIIGVFYLLLNNSTGLNLLTMLVLGVASIGVLKELSNKSNIMCACLGTIIKLPLSKVSLVEDVAMFAMAAVMLFL